MPLHVVCVPSPEASASVSPCGDVGGVHHLPAVMEMPAPGAVTFANAQQLFDYGFVAVVGVWAVGIAVGSILSVIKKG